jgi:tetratricopeptide (TPR) repeat protein
VAKEIIRQAAHRMLPALFLRQRSDRIEPAVGERLGIYEVMAWIDFFIDQERLLLDSVTALNVAEKVDLGSGIATGATGVGIICDVIGLFRLGNHYHRHSAAVAEQTGHPPSIGNAYMGWGLHRLYSGQWDETAVEQLEKAAEAYQKTGDLRERGTIISILRQMYLWKGDFARSLELCQELIQIGQDGSDPLLWAWGLQGAGAVWQRTGPLDEAIASLAKAVDLQGSIPNYVEQVEAMGELGWCYLRQGDVAAATAIVDEAEQLKIEHSLMEIVVNSPRNARAEVYLVKAEQADESEKAAMMKKAGQACRMLLKTCKTFHIGLPVAARLRGRHEWLRGKPRAARRWWQRGLAAAEDLGARYEVGMLHLEVGRRLEDRARLERAEAIFAEIGARMDLEQVRALLGGAEARS